MIYNFVFEGGHLDGEVVLEDFAIPAASIPRAAQWIDCTLGGAVGLNLVVLGSASCEAPKPGPENKTAPIEFENQIYRVIYRDQHAGAVLIRCRHIPGNGHLSHETRRIVFTFAGGFKDGVTELCAIPCSDENPSSGQSLNRFYATDNGTVGKQFGACSIATLQALRNEGLEATRNRDEPLHIYEVISRTDDGQELRVHCKFVRSA